MPRFHMVKTVLHAVSLLWLCFNHSGLEAQNITASVAHAEQIFLKDVLPALQNTCFTCHSGSIAFSELSMTDRASLLTGGLRGPAIVPGDPDNSLLIQAAEHTNEELIMPPAPIAALPPDVIAKLRIWIAAGAPWAETGAPAQPGQWTGYADDESRWAFHPIQRFSPPDPGMTPEACHTPVDNFIFAALHQQGITPAPATDRVTLLRRATFDLTGLPPTPTDIDAFVADTSANAFEQVVERLLASPRYGEQWGRHWLDVVRYADTGGFSNDWERPNAWRYRDYVIRCFNEDKPYDRFIVEQLAGDELDPAAPDNLIATGFLRMGPWEHTGMVVEAVSRQLFLDDVTQSTVTTFLGLTARCASCHDHKFDPIPTRDYYRVQAVFTPVRFEDRPVPFLTSENQASFYEGTARAEAYITLNKKRNDAVENAVHERLKKEFGVQNIKDLPVELVRDSVLHAVGELQRAYHKRIEYYERELQRYQPLTYSVSSGGLAKPVETPDTHILIGGSLQSPGEVVTPGVYSAVSGSDDAAGATAWNTIPVSLHGRRLALANWLASPSNPLTARVMVNRIWQYHFGTGLVATSNNFGKLGSRPTHPELLDWLAQYFIEHRWSVKAMHRLIMLSSAYQRSSTPQNLTQTAVVDPDNKLLSYFPARRLTAEELRDAMLSVAGSLNLEMGGPGTFPEINTELALQPRQIMGTIAPMYEPSRTPDQRNRRTIYTFQRRSLVNPMIEVFNGPDLNKSCERREATTVTPQVFNLFHSRFTHDTALAMADALPSQATGRAAQINRAYLLAYGRTPGVEELRRCEEHLDRMQTYHTTNVPAVPAPPKKVVRSIIGELSGKQFDFEEEWDPSLYQPNQRPHDVDAGTRALADLCLVLLNSNEFAYVY